MFNFSSLALLGVTYLLFLFGVAWLTEKKYLPEAWVKHPFTQVLSIGVYASAWTFYGVFGMVHQAGYGYLWLSMGAVVAFFMSKLLLIPLLRITRTYQLSSLADLFAFRFRSRSVALLTTILTLLATLPLLAIQILAVTDTLYLINSNFEPSHIGLGFCVIVALFSILFGARYASLRTQHQGLVVAMAAASVIKLVALLTISGFSFLIILGGLEGTASFFQSYPEQLGQFLKPTNSGEIRTLVLETFAAALVMPHMFHMLFTENNSENTLRKASWIIPLILFLLTLAVPPVLWAGSKLAVDGDAQFMVLHLGLLLKSGWLTILAFIGGFSAASGVMIVCSVAVASMLQNHLVLPMIPKPRIANFYASLLWLRRFLIILLLVAAWFFSRQISEIHQSLYHVGIVSITAFLQFLPGIIVTLFWPKANAKGMLLGLITGTCIWLFSMLAPLSVVSGNNPLILTDNWYQPAMVSLLFNTVVMVIVSLLSQQSSEELKIAESCLLNALQKPLARVQVSGVDDFTALLTTRLGESAAKKEINKALTMLGLIGVDSQIKPVDLLRLRILLETNLSGRLGPIEAAALLKPLDAPRDPGVLSADSVQLIEGQLEHYRARLTGLAAELDLMRRYHRLILQEIPVGVCTLDSDTQVLFWNGEMASMTDIPSDKIVGTSLKDHASQWCSLLEKFAYSKNIQQAEEKHIINSMPRWISLHKTALKEQSDMGIAILLEDKTSTYLMQEQLAHSERLASIGRFAAGVAHEIGNPVTGIACLAQNLKLETDNAEVLDMGQQIVEQTGRINRIVQSLMKFAHAGQAGTDTEFQPISLATCANEAIHLLSLDMDTKSLSYINDIPKDLKVLGDIQQLQQVMVNLLKNASDASPKEGRIQLLAETEEARVKLHIIDEGEGIKPELKAHIFEPFFTTKEPGHGTGLGLSLVYNIIAKHCGTIEIISPTNNNKKGTQIIITLPTLA